MHSVINKRKKMHHNQNTIILRIHFLVNFILYFVMLNIMSTSGFTVLFHQFYSWLLRPLEGTENNRIAAVLDIREQILTLKSTFLLPDSGNMNVKSKIHSLHWLD